MINIVLLFSYLFLFYYFFFIIALLKLQPSNFIVRVHHLECIRDGGILDPDDLLFDVFDEERDQV